jgi:hypothetical protein
LPPSVDWLKAIPSIGIGSVGVVPARRDKIAPFTGLTAGENRGVAERLARVQTDQPTTEMSCAKTCVLHVAPLFDEKIDSMLSPDGVAF